VLVSGSVTSSGRPPHYSCTVARCADPPVARLFRPSGSIAVFLRTPCRQKPKQAQAHSAARPPVPLSFRWARLRLHANARSRCCRPPGVRPAHTARLSPTAGPTHKANRAAHQPVRALALRLVAKGSRPVTQHTSDHSAQVLVQPADSSALWATRGPSAWSTGRPERPPPLSRRSPRLRRCCNGRRRAGLRQSTVLGAGRRRVPPRPAHGATATIATRTRPPVNRAPRSRTEVRDARAIRTAVTVRRSTAAAAATSRPRSSLPHIRGCRQNWSIRSCNGWSGSVELKPACWISRVFSHAAANSDSPASAISRAKSCLISTRTEHCASPGSCAVARRTAA
jgi:hypothetical protein